MTIEIAFRRLSAQQLHDPQWRKPARVVAWLCGVQAQNPAWAQWSIGQRLYAGTSAVVERAIDQQCVVRTWAFRGTLHYVAASDLPWLIPLLAPAITARNARRYQQLGLDESTFAQSSQVIRDVLEPGQALARSTIGHALEDAGISAKGQRIYYLLQRAALDGAVCLGPQQGRQSTYLLTSHWIGTQAATNPRDPLAMLAERYFGSHGPATIQDFAWWSGLQVAAARQALAAVQTLVRVEVDGKTLWAAQEALPEPGRCTAYLLGPYDAYLLGYADRSSALNPSDTKRVNAGGGMPKPTIIVDGKVAGTWKRSPKRNRIVVALEPFRELSKAETEAIDQAAQRYGEFHARPVEIQRPDN
jgi:hypothetical protein